MDASENKKCTRDGRQYRMEWKGVYQLDKYFDILVIVCGQLYPLLLPPTYLVLKTHLRMAYTILHATLECLYNYESWDDAAITQNKDVYDRKAGKSEKYARPCWFPGSPRSPQVAAFLRMALPCELIDEVLCRVPVKYLLRCRCVSKEWCSLIDSTAFIKKHLKTTTECNAPGVILTGEQSLFLTDLESLSAEEEVNVVEIRDPLKTIFPDAEFVGAANSLLCFCKNNAYEFLIYNPATRKYRKVPDMPYMFVLWFDMVTVSHCGFGYDHVNDDYKVVKIAEFCGMMVIVYSLKSNCWTQIHDVPRNILIHPSSRKGMFASGALHWVAAKSQPPDGCFIVLGFDLGLEHFKELPSPVARYGDFYIADGGSLCILEQCTKSRTDVWLINNYGAENPWYKAFSVEKPCALGSYKAFRPVAFSRSGKDVLLEVDQDQDQDRTKLLWYDPEKKVVKNARIHGIPSKFGANLYRKSLLQLTVNEQRWKSSEDKEKKKQQKKRKKEEKQQKKR
ncbi:hypothetical protein ACET3Z_014078 [Daucus carota]